MSVTPAANGARGRAGTALEAATDPLRAISQPLLLHQRGDNPRIVEWRDLLKVDRASPLSDYARLVRTKRVFAIGGLSLVIKCGLVNDWYRNDANRDEAMKLIDERGCRGTLDALTDKDASHSIFGKNDVRSFFSTFPAVMRQGASGLGRDRVTSPRYTRKEHPLRLRKAIEFLFLTEAILRYRFSQNETIYRFVQATGTTVESPDDAKKIWDYMWIEPLVYTLDPLPRRADIARIMAGEDPQWFSERSNQREGALYWALRGVPGMLRTAEAAAEICTRFYGPQGAPTYAVAIDPHNFDRGMDKLMDYDEAGAMMPVENVVLL
jgi:hypothetical protein